MTIEELEQKTEELEKIINRFEIVLKNHTHSGLETSGRLEPKNLIIETFTATDLEATGAATNSFISADGKSVSVVKGIVKTIT